MKPPCSEPECERESLAQGLCAKHYQALRRRQRGARAKPGPVPKLPPDIYERYDGAPQVTIRLQPDLFAWVRERGGVAFVRRVLQQLHDEGTARVEEPGEG